MKIDVLTARELAWVDATQTRVNMVVQFAHLHEGVPYTAASDDPEEHGRDLFDRAVAGEFGEIVEYVPPTPLEIAARDNPPLRKAELAHAMLQASHWDMMGDTTRADAWRSYYREIYTLEQAPDWPQIDQWPTAPELAA